MTVTAIVGASWGDEGKGKMTDALAAQATYVVRYQGGSNAGHTIINEYGKFALHMLPSGVFYPHVTNVIGPGAALDGQMLLQEYDKLLASGVPAPCLRISDRAQVVLPVHRLLDALEEERLGADSFGSTRQGIAPFYADKYAKLGIQTSDLYDEQRLLRKLEQSLAAKNVLLEQLYKQAPLDARSLLPELLELGERLRPHLCDTRLLLHDAYSRGDSIVLEGQLGALRDPDHGIYPYSTSSSTLAGFAAVGAGLPPYAITRIIAVVKAYSSCVGAGPFPVELTGADGNELRRRGGDAGEYGALTGRPRRVGWFDAAAIRYGCAIQGATEIALTNLDVLGYLERIPVCVGYEVDGEQLAAFPATSMLDQARPIIETLPGWGCDISQAGSFADLPAAAQQYVRFVEKAAGVRVSSVSVGPRREQLFY
jgi:adenylosuccinate synthase